MNNLYIKILKSIKKSLNETLNGELSLENIINDNILIFPADFSIWWERVYNMLTLSYKNLGGLKSYQGIRDFKSRKHLLKIVLSKNNELLACATYRKIESSLKMVAIGCNQKDNGKIAIQQIVIDDIQNENMHYWAEVSGSIEHYFKKYKGYPMPNILAPEILNISSSKIILSNEDMVHYERLIASDEDYSRKMIFGIKSQEIFEKVIEAVGNYEDFMNEVNKIEESKQLCIYSPKQAIYIIENIYRLHEEGGYNELIPKWHKALKDSLDSLYYAKKHHLYNEEWCDDYIGYGEYLIKHMPLLKLHKLKHF